MWIRWKIFESDILLFVMFKFNLKVMFCAFHYNKANTKAYLCSYFAQQM
jgi:hypothetical protein